MEAAMIPQGGATAAGEGQVVINVGGDAKAMRRELFTAAMEEKWDVVLKKYKENPVCRRWSLTRHRENTLHVMVMWARKRQTIRDFIEVLKGFPRDEAGELLKLKDDEGDNALHAAAARGITKLCKALGELAPGLVAGSRNDSGETPLFLTYISGSTSTFLTFCHIAEADLRGDEAFIRACKRTDGTTLLHFAIYREHFELAFHIISRCPNIVNIEDANGETPLVFLAQKRHLFRSSYRFGLRQSLVYSVLKITPLKVREDHEQLTTRGKTFAKYCSWIQLFNGDQDGVGTQEDLENPWEARYREYKRRDVAQLSLINSFMLALFGIGLWTNVQKVLEMKQRHEHAKQIMDLLIKHATDWEYDPNEIGQKPKEENSISRNSKFTEKFTQENQIVEIVIDDGDKNCRGSRDERVQSQERGPLTSKTLNAHPNQWIRILVENVQDGKLSVQPKEEMKKKVSPLLVAARVGIIEIVRSILEKFPIASEDVDATDKNVVLVAIENRHPHIYRYLQKKCLPKDFSHVDKDGNSALHLAAKLGKSNQPWIIPGAALQMQWEIKWYEFVKNSFTSQYFFSLYNYEKNMPYTVFIEEHKQMVEEGRTWLKDTATSCSIIVALIATVAFASSVTVPGGTKGDSGTPILEQKAGFGIFAMSSLMSLCFSIISLIMFISILTSRFKENAFKKILPLMLIIGLTFMMLSISSSLVIFCSGHYFIISHKLKYVAIPIYAITCLSASLFAMANFNLYKDLIKSAITRVPERSYI